MTQRRGTFWGPFPILGEVRGTGVLRTVQEISFPGTVLGELSLQTEFRAERGLNTARQSRQMLWLFPVICRVVKCKGLKQNSAKADAGRSEVA